MLLTTELRLLGREGRSGAVEVEVVVEVEVAGLAAEGEVAVIAVEVTGLPAVGAVGNVFPIHESIRESMGEGEA